LSASAAATEAPQEWPRTIARATPIFASAAWMIGLRLRRPDHRARPLAVAEARPIERDDAVLLRGHIEEAARCEILHHAAIAVQQHERLALSALDIVQTHAVDFDEAAGRRIVAFGLIGSMAIVNRGERQRAYCGGGDGEGA
jgi:hypothetical protein